MYIAYFDETGDDGYPKFSSELFVLTSLYLDHKDWKEIHDKLRLLRSNLRLQYAIPMKVEFHTKKFLLNKNPYAEFKLSDQDRLEICMQTAEILRGLKLRVVNVCINKNKINGNNQKFYKNILDSALNYNVQRIENDLRKQESNFLIITDEGRVAKMRTTTRRIQQINFIPSIFAGSYRKEIKLLLEDPLPKNSKESYFIQMADFISFFVFLNMVKELGVGKWHNRLSWLDKSSVDEILYLLKPIFNLEASKSHSLGVVYYPK